MSPKVAKILGTLAVIAPIVFDAIMKFRAGQMVDWNLVVSTVVAALGGSQLLPRKDDIAKSKHEEVVAKAADAAYEQGRTDAVRASVTPNGE